MSVSRILSRLGLATLLLAGLGACTVVPAYPVARPYPSPVYIETYPSYYYIPGGGDRHHGYRHRHYRDERPHFDRWRERRGGRD